MMILCNRLTGEDWLIIILVTKVLVGLLLQMSWNIPHEWAYHCLAGSLVLQVLSIIFFPRPKDGRKGSDTFRTAEQSGIFCILLVPLCFLAEISYTANNSSSCHSRIEEVSFLLACNSIMLMMSSRMLPSLNSVHSTVFMRTAFSLSSGLVLLPVVLTTGSSIMAIAFGIVVVVASVTHLPRLCPRSFTFGELCVVCHLAGDFVWRSMRWLLEFISNQGRPPISEEACLYVLISVICIFVAFATTTILLLKPVNNTLFFILLYCIFTIMGFGTYRHITNLNPAVWLLQFVFTRQERFLLLGWWLLLTVVTAVGVCLYPALAEKTGTVDKASTAMRKCFHLVVVAVYVPGLVHDPAFLLLASVVALAVLTLFETARVTRVKWLGTTIDIAFHVFTDSRDQGPVLLTHIYLLVGLSVPLWLSCNVNNKAMLLQLSSGILSLGIGDTVACVAGMRYGLTKWPGTCKSLQGTGFSVIAQLIFIATGLLLGWFGSFSWPGVVFAVVASSVYEALTSQIDNLVLPLYTLAALPM